MMRDSRPLKGRVLAWVLGIVVVGLGAAVVYVATQPPLFTPSHGRYYLIELVNETDDQVVTIDEEHVQAHAPAFHAMLEETVLEGNSMTRDRGVQAEIREYMRELTGSPELNLGLDYRGHLLELFG